MRSRKPAALLSPVYGQALPGKPQGHKKIKSLIAQLFFNSKPASSGFLICREPSYKVQPCRRALHIDNSLVSHETTQIHVNTKVKPLYLFEESVSYETLIYG